MSRIVRNSILNGSAMAATSVLSLLLVPILVNNYGLDSYGLIPLIRLLTPLGVVGLLVLGLPVLATRASASSISEKRCTEQSTLLFAGVILGATLSLILLILGWHTLASWFNVEPAEQTAFTTGFYVLLGTCPILFAGHILTSALTGLGHFRALRVTEVTVFILYFVVALAAAWLGAPIEIVLIAMLTGDCVRTAVLSIYANRIGLISLDALLKPDWHWFRSMMGDLRVLTVSQISGYARKYAPSTIATLIFGPAAVGLYDAVERVPRAFKTLLGLVNTAVLPRTLELDQANNKNQLNSLIIRGNRLMLFFMLPMNVCVMFYAAPLFAVWLGPDLRYAAPLLVLLMVQYALEMMLSIFSTASLSRIGLMRRQNMVNAVETICIVALTALLAPTFDQTAIYASVAIAATAGYLLRIGSFMESYGVPNAEWNNSAGKTLVGATAGSAVIYLSANWMLSNDMALLFTAPVAVVTATALIFLLWTDNERRDVGIVFGSLRKLVAR